MSKKVTLAAAMVHAPAVLVLDEPLEAVDPVSAADPPHPHRFRRPAAPWSLRHVMDLVERCAPTSP